jgi:hypothetical protein
MRRDDEFARPAVGHRELTDEEHDYLERVGRSDRADAELWQVVMAGLLAGLSWVVVLLFALWVAWRRS